MDWPLAMHRIYVGEYEKKGPSSLRGQRADDAYDMCLTQANSLSSINTMPDKRLPETRLPNKTAILE